VRLDHAIRVVAERLTRKERSVRNIFYDTTKDGDDGRKLRAEYEALEELELLEPRSPEPDTF
jgi:hypothetical protein